MNWEAIGAVGEVFGGFAIVISFFYLGRQIKVSAKQQRMESHRAMAELQIGTNKIFYDPKLTRLVIDGMNDWESASFDEINVTRQWLTDTVTHYQAMFEMWRQGGIDNEAWAAEEDFLVKELLATPGGRAYWTEYSTLFGRNFIRHIEPRIEDEPIGIFKREYEILQKERSENA
jgi:hypothetical protein